jgi:hypothetical protein
VTAHPQLADRDIDQAGQQRRPADERQPRDDRRIVDAQVALGHQRPGADGPEEEKRSADGEQDARPARHPDGRGTRDRMRAGRE